MRRPVGLDLNGWRDHGCRDWTADDPEAPAGRPIHLDGGIRSVVVEHDDVLVGGPQAILSPIGRGNGWSTVGDITKRRDLAGHWSDLLADTTRPCFDRDMRAAAAALSVMADGRVLCVPDHAGMGEARQKRLLAAFSGPREPKTILLWRSVAVVLGLLEAGLLPGAEDGMRIACLVHGADGIEQQLLVLRQIAGHPGVLAPERARPGEIRCPAAGLVHLLAGAAAAVMAANPALHERPTEMPRMAADLLFRDAPLHGEEIVRRDNGNWLKVRTPRDFLPAALLSQVSSPVTDADLVVLLSPLASRHRERLGEGLGGGVIVAEPNTAAAGALVAARRIERGIPHYLDHLDQISLIAMRGGTPAFEDLIPANATVPGNREYVSAPITSLVWTAGMAEVQFHIRKGASEIRSWKTNAPSPPERNEKLEIHLRQMPAQGWATLSITAPDWEALRRAPIRLDWGALEIDGRSEAEILATLQRPRPVVPNRVCHQAHLGLWDGSLRRGSMRDLLLRFRPDDPATLFDLAATVASGCSLLGGAGHDQRATFYAVSTDGELPAGVDETTRQMFDAVSRRISSDLRSASAARPGLLTNNDALRYLTWIFAACPQEAQALVIAAFDAMLAGADHPLLRPRGGRTVVIHGLGRIIADRESIRRLLPLLCGRLPATDLLAPLASMLSRPTATPSLLAELDVERIAGHLVPVLRSHRQAARFGTDYKYLLMILAGLLRVREHDPWALTHDTSQVARALVAELRSAALGLENGSGRIPAADQKKTATTELIKHIETNEGRPDILTHIDHIEP